MSQAASLGVKIVDIDGLKALAKGGEPQDAKIEAYSRGFGNNGLALRLGGESFLSLKE